MVLKKPNIIREIAQELDCGFDCYYNFKTDEILTIPNSLQFTDEENFKEAFQLEFQKIQENEADYNKFEVLKSFESFKIMERFVAQISDNNFQSELDIILKKKKPFQNFKKVIDHSDFGQNWFEFKQNELEKIVESKMSFFYDSNNL
ncbi:UPF0158 family protein [Cellulophaga baltica]|nr:UPF0158 family protein [Cellulophaga baltica]